MKNALERLVNIQKEGRAVGIYSACSANPLVIEAVIRKGLSDDSCVLIEATANQCDQFGGYTGMKPADFRDFVYKIADENGFDRSRIFLGGDHLGPLTWTYLNEGKAMKKASGLIEAYVSAGFTKIHLDTSMKVASDDPDLRLSDETIAKRGALLCKVAEEAYTKLLESNQNAVEPVYIIGSEVPIPGGSKGAVEEGLQITKVSDLNATIEAFRNAFLEQGLSDAWKRVLAVVVQPGVEEKDSGCTEYDRTKAADLSAAIRKIPNLIFEGHSTDYQTRYKLKEMVEDGIGILKVGPGLTFAAREALYALSFIEDEICRVRNIKPSYFRIILDEEMLKNDRNWKKYYLGTPREIALKRKYSFSDRSRYYYATAEVKQAIDTLLYNLKDGVPLNLLSQFMPIQYARVRDGSLKNDPKELILNRIGDTIDDYLYATNQRELLR